MKGKTAFSLLFLFLTVIFFMAGNPLLSGLSFIIMVFLVFPDVLETMEKTKPEVSEDFAAEWSSEAGKKARELTFSPDTYRWQSKKTITRTGTGAKKLAEGFFKIFK